jgi:hypothetical protein
VSRSTPIFLLCCEPGLSSVATDIMGQSSRAMLEALIEGETDPAALADLAKRRLRSSPSRPLTLSVSLWFCRVVRWLAAPDRLGQLSAVHECRVLVSAAHVGHLRFGQSALGKHRVVEALPSLDPHE